MEHERWQHSLTHHQRLGWTQHSTHATFDTTSCHTLLQRTIAIHHAGSLLVKAEPAFTTHVCIGRMVLEYQV